MQQTFFYLKSVYYGSDCVKSEFQYALSKKICKCLKFRTLVIIINQLNNLITYIMKYLKYTHTKKKKMLKTFIFTLIINYTIFFC